MSETSEILRTLLERLQFAQNQGKLWYTRLNSGTIYATYTKKSTGETKGRAIKLCKKGTADVIVIQRTGYVTNRRRASLVTFLETKLKNGKLSDAQLAFKAMVEEQGALYLTVKELTDATGPLGLEEG